MSGSSFTLCAKCGNIKPAGVTNCEFCAGQANSVSLEDLKRGLQSAQPAGAQPPQKGAQPDALARLQEVAPPVMSPQVTPPQVTPPHVAQNARASETAPGPSRPPLERTNQSARTALSGAPQPEPGEIKHNNPHSQSSTSDEPNTAARVESMAKRPIPVRSAVPAQPAPAQPVKRTDTGGGFMGWLRRLFRF